MKLLAQGWVLGIQLCMRQNPCPQGACCLMGLGDWDIQLSSVQSLSRVWLFETPWTAACQASLSITNSWSLLKLLSIKSVMPANYLILCCPLFLLPSIFPSIRVFSNESVLHIRWPKCCSFSFSISPFNEYSWLISVRIDWLHLLAGTLKSLLQHHSSKASVLQRSAFFIVQVSYPHMTTGKTIALIRWTFVGKVMSLSFNVLSRLVIAFLHWGMEFFFTLRYEVFPPWGVEFCYSVYFCQGSRSNWHLLEDF